MMKAMNLLSAAATILLASAFAACSSDALVNETPVQEEQQKVSLTVKATQGTRTPDTRLLYTDPDDGTGITVNWGTSEELGVVSYVDGEVYTLSYTDPVLSGTSDGKSNTMTFSGTGITESNGDMAGKYNFYYPTAQNSLALALSGGGGKSYVDFNYNDYGFAQSCDLSKPTANLSAFNLMYTEEAVDPSEGITLKHACALLRFKLTLPPAASKATKLTISAWNYAFSRMATITYDATGKATVAPYGTTYSYDLSLTNDPWESGEHLVTAYMLIPGTNDFTGLLCKVSVVDDAGKVFSYVYNLTEGDSDETNDKLLPEKVYTFTAALKEDPWADSNVYQESGNPFFIYQVHIINYSLHQGLFYKWGSLQGIAPASNWENGKTSVYPMGDLTGTYTYDQVPYDGGAADLDDETNDICTKINPDWRLPSKGEWEDLIAEGYDIISSSNTNITNNQGYGAVYDGVLFDNLLYLPSSGRMNNSGEIYEFGVTSYYWTKTVDDASTAYRLTYGNLKTDEAGAPPRYLIMSTNKENAAAIRCIKKVWSGSK
jgi:uncharacterized protein (TIGR02145 family)